MFFETKEIYYFDSYYRKTHLHTSSKEFRVNKKLNQIQEYLAGHPFIRIHRNYLVNMEKVKFLKKNQIILRNGVTLDISARRKIFVYDAAKNYLTLRNELEN